MQHVHDLPVLLAPQRKTTQALFFPSLCHGTPPGAPPGTIGTVKGGTRLPSITRVKSGPWTKFPQSISQSVSQSCKANKEARRPELWTLKADTTSCTSGASSKATQANSHHAFYPLRPGLAAGSGACTRAHKASPCTQQQPQGGCLTCRQTPALRTFERYNSLLHTLAHQRKRQSRPAFGYQAPTRCNKQPQPLARRPALLAAPKSAQQRRCVGLRRHCM